MTNPLLGSDKSFKLQFFGDLYLPSHVLKKTASTPQDPKVFEGVKGLLNQSPYNIVNFEGVATHAVMPQVLKSHLLKMPLTVGQLLKNAQINVANLANNHAMDFGWPGLFDTISSLSTAGIKTLGAGENIEQATKPLILPFAERKACLFGFSRTLPSDFWASEKRSGTAYLNSSETASAIKKCTKMGHFTVAMFHWGSELQRLPKSYQKALARSVIDSGADLVIGHHPHILQSVEIYKNRPIFYSIGNFAFGTLVLKRPQEGIVVAVGVSPKSNQLTYVITPLNVQNSETGFIPQVAKDPKKRAKELFENLKGCHWKSESSHWICQFQEGSKPSVATLQSSDQEVGESKKEP